MPSHARVTRLASAFSWVTLIAAIALPLMVVAIWLNIEQLAGPALGNIGIAYNPATIIGSTRWLGMLVGLVGAGIQVFGLLSLRQTFLEASAGRWLSLEAVQAFRRFAWVSVAMVFIRILQNMAYSMILSRSANGQGQLAIIVGTNELKALFLALLFVFVAHIFAIGRAADEENKGFL